MFFRRVRRVLAALPPLTGRPIRIQKGPGLRDRHGEVHAGSFLRERRIVFNCRARDFPRIFVHEVFHFVWMRLGNRWRRSWETLLKEELEERARGELGWSAEWRKAELTGKDRLRRTRRWREYCCESFCDTAAWLYAGTGSNEEFTLPRRWREGRGLWFSRTVDRDGLSI